LKKEGIKHEVLNAKYHEKEAEIIAQAGKFGAVTIATNMAGAFNTSCLIPSFFNILLNFSDFSIETVPINTGCPKTRNEKK